MSFQETHSVLSKSGRDQRPTSKAPSSVGVNPPGSMSFSFGSVDSNDGFVDLRTNVDLLQLATEIQTKQALKAKEDTLERSQTSVLSDVGSVEVVKISTPTNAQDFPVMSQQTRDLAQISEQIQQPSRNSTMKSAIFRRRGKGHYFDMITEDTASSSETDTSPTEASPPEPMVEDSATLSSAESMCSF